MPRILIVDDEPRNRELIHAYLDGGEYQLVDAASGSEALAAAAASPPDLVLLDINMPGLDGFETARRLKAQTTSGFLPIILVTALSDRGSRMQGLSAGADEFLIKPLDRHELALRVSNLLALRAHERALAQRNLELLELQRSNEEMSELVVHDLKNPLAIMLGNVEFLLEDTPEGERRQALLDALAAGQRANRLLSNLLQLTRIEARRFDPLRTPARLGALIDPIIAQRARLAESRGIRLSVSGDLDATWRMDLDLMTRVVENVLDNGMRHTPSGGVIAVQSEPTPSGVQLAIGNSGPPVPTAARMLIFEKFGQATPAVGRTNLGLGLYFCRLATEAHGGRMWVEERPVLPTVFCIELPA